MKDRRRVEDMLSDFVGTILKNGKSPGYAAGYLKAVRSWLNYNEIRLVRRIKIGNSDATPTLEGKVFDNVDGVCWFKASNIRECSRYRRINVEGSA